MKANAQTEAEKLELFISENYAQPLTLNFISKTLSMSKSKLYLLAAQIEPGMTICGMIKRRRIAAAKQLLTRPDATVRDVAEKVGIPDYNYFTKVFKTATLMTPSQYHKMAKEPLVI
jgi:AraC-like DNA-binding protein